MEHETIHYKAWRNASLYTNVSVAFINNNKFMAWVDYCMDDHDISLVFDGMKLLVHAVPPMAVKISRCWG